MAFKKFTHSAEQLSPDPRFNSKLVAKFINTMMWQGKKATALRIFYDAMDTVSKRIKDVPPLEVFETAIGNVKPNVEVRSKRVGGSNYQVPMSVGRRRQQSLACRWLISAARSGSGKPMSEFLASEICAAFKGEGSAMKKRDDVHKMADANKAFSHFAWGRSGGA